MKPMLIAAALAVSLTPAVAEEAPVNVVATIGMIGDVVQNVGGNCVDATTIMGPGVDPHLYKAGAGDVHSFQTADVIFYSGYALEGQLGEVFAAFAKRKPTVAVAEASIEPTELLQAQGSHGYDPHIWMDAALWGRIAGTIAKTLAEQRPDCAAQLTENAERYTAQINALDGWAREAISSIPEGQRTLVTAHDAFAYYGRAYGIEVQGIQGISTESEASIADIRATATLVAEKGVPAIFIESTINPRTIQSVIEAAREQGQDIQIGGALFSDAMGESGTAGGTYIGMIFENTRTITTALGGTVPPLPPELADWAKQWDAAPVAE